MGSFELSLIVTICGSGDAIDDIEIISRLSSPDISVELRTTGVLGLGTLWSFDDCFTLKTSESVDLSDKLNGILRVLKILKNIHLIEATDFNR